MKQEELKETSGGKQPDHSLLDEIYVVRFL